MVASGIAAKLDTPMWLNKAGEIVEYELVFSKKTIHASTPSQIVVC